jgi:hypothetical protein
MRVLLDGDRPKDFARRLVGHEVDTIHQRRWSDLSNGALLDAAAGEYDVFVTLDQSLQFQQNLADRSIAVIVLRAQSNRIADLAALVQPLLATLPVALRSHVTIVAGRGSSAES